MSGAYDPRVLGRATEPYHGVQHLCGARAGIWSIEDGGAELGGIGLSRGLRIPWVVGRGVN